PFLSTSWTQEPLTSSVLSPRLGVVRRTIQPPVRIPGPGDVPALGPGPGAGRAERERQGEAPGPWAHAAFLSGHHTPGDRARAHDGKVDFDALACPGTGWRGHRPDQGRLGGGSASRGAQVPMVRVGCGKTTVETASRRSLGISGARAQSHDLDRA